MDLLDALVPLGTAAIGALAVLAGVGLSGRQARGAAEDAEKRLLARERDDRVRQARLEAIDHTERAYCAMLADQLNQASGGEPLGLRYGPEMFPRADVRLVGEAAVAREFIETSVMLAARPRGTPAHVSDAAAVASAQRALIGALERQADRIRRDEPLLDLVVSSEDAAVVTASMARVGLEADG